MPRRGIARPGTYAEGPSKCGGVLEILSMAEPGAVEELPESRLGTKEHWDHVYAYVLGLNKSRDRYVQGNWR